MERFAYKTKVLARVLNVFASMTFLISLIDLYMGKSADVLADLFVAVIAFVTVIYFKKTSNLVVAGTVLFWAVALSAMFFCYEYRFDSNVIYLILTPVIALLVLPLFYVVLNIIVYEVLVVFLFVYGYAHFPNSHFLFSYNGIVNYIFGSLFIFTVWWFYHKVMEHTLGRLEKAHTEKNLLLQELHHRVKNNFNLITSMLQMQHAHDGTHAAPAFVAAFKNRVDSISAAHELLYKESALDTIDLRAYVRGLCDNVVAGCNLQHPVNIRYDIVSHRLSIDTLIYVGILINEMLTNALKHAFDSEGGEISIAVQYRGQSEYRLLFSDDGKGFSETSLSRGFGQQVIRMAVEQLEAEMTRTDEGGTHYRIVFFVKETQ